MCYRILSDSNTHNFCPVENYGFLVLFLSYKTLICFVSSPETCLSKAVLTLLELLQTSQAEGSVLPKTPLTSDTNCKAQGSHTHDQLATNLEVPPYVFMCDNLPEQFTKLRVALSLHLQFYYEESKSGLGRCRDTWGVLNAKLPRPQDVSPCHHIHTYHQPEKLPHVWVFRVFLTQTWLIKSLTINSVSSCLPFPGDQAVIIQLKPQHSWMASLHLRIT